MTTKNKIILAVVALATAYAFGRFSAPTKVRIEKEIVEVERKTEDKQLEVDRDKVKHTKTTETTSPDGTTTKTTETREETRSTKKAAESSTTDRETASTETKEITRSSGNLSISLLAGIPISGLPAIPVYGAHVHRNLIGPITIGLFGLNSGVVGASVGLNF